MTNLGDALWCSRAGAWSEQQRNPKTVCEKKNFGAPWGASIFFLVSAAACAGPEAAANYYVTKTTTTTTADQK